MGYMAQIRHFATSTTRPSTSTRPPPPPSSPLDSPPPSSPLVSVLHLRLLAPLAFPLHPRDALAPLRYRRRRRLGAPAPARVPSPVPPSLQSDLADFLCQQHCNFLQYRKAIAVFHSLSCRPAKSCPVEAESVASDC